MRAVATQNREYPRPGDEVLEENVLDKPQYAKDAPAGAALIAQAMDRREGVGRYKAMQSIMDWDRSRLAYRAVKRTFDIVFSGAALVAIAIPSLVLAALIRLESEGSPFYSQIRVGQTRPDGSLTTFRMWKFRSMYKDADERLVELKEQNEIAGAMFKMKEDPRVTRIGRFIRKHSLAPVIIGTPGDGEPTKSLSHPVNSSLDLHKCERRPEPFLVAQTHYTSFQFLSFAVFGGFNAVSGRPLCACGAAPFKDFRAVA